MSHGAQHGAPASSLPSIPTPPSSCAVDSFQRRLRHITSVQIVNLTPFPVRDAFATALSQPATHPQFTPLGNLSDDLDVTLLRKRTRRISSTSANTPKNFKVDDVSGSPVDTRGSMDGRRKGQARPSISGNGSAAPGPVSGSTAARPTTTLHFDHSQRTLEKVVQSRLVETFITFTVPDESLLPLPEPPNTSVPTRSRSESGPPPTNNIPASPLSRTSRTSRSTNIGALKALSGRVGATSTTPSPSSARRVHPTSKPTTASPRQATKTHKLSSSAPLQKSNSQQSPARSPEVRPRSTPNYISAVHRPSTNPIFAIDPSSDEYARHTDLGAESLKIELWAKTEIGSLVANSKGKQKEVTEASNSPPGSEWKLLDEWNVALSDLIPLPLELENRQSYLPSNTLVLTFSSSRQCFYLPPTSKVPLHAHSRSRSTSPSGYNTDPEAEVRRLDHFTPTVSSDPALTSDNYSRLSLSRRGRRTTAVTASSQQLLQLVTLQACIRDTEESLHAVIKETDKLLSSSDIMALSREASEREVRVQDRQSEMRAIVERASTLRDDIASRRRRIQARREHLGKAKTLRGEDAVLSNTAAVITEQRNSLAAVRHRITPIRTLHISELATIYPIDLDSPSHLLYTILGIPLPIPLNGNEPAPPLSLPSHKEVTEDAVATALGYAAHLVQLLSVYMGKGLVYPVTYVGSRSLIRDNISAMVGPRMFPLFSKGVDTYRFEYAVFLLNKDIEMLMAERDLRALDMRHTLHNLKNLLLTLTDGEHTNLRHFRIHDSPCISDLATPPRSPSPPAHSDTPKAGRSPHSVTTELPRESDTPAISGRATPTDTPTEATTLSRYPKLTLGFPPLPGFLRSRNPSSVLRSSTRLTSDQADEGQQSTSSALGVVVNPSESEASTRQNAGEDDDDRRTIKGMNIRTEQTAEGKRVHEHIPRNSPTQEKLSDETLSAAPSTAIHVESGHQ